MACHLSHKLPWDTLHEIAMLLPDPEAPWPRPRVQLTVTQRKKLDHFARCLSSAIVEFKASDNTSDDEHHGFDPRTWDVHAEGSGAHIGFYASLLGGYLALNLLLMDAKRFRRHCELGHFGSTYLVALLGFHDGSHPRHMSDRLAPMLTSYSPREIELKPLTREVMQVIRDHAAMMFRCMYSISGENRLLDADYVLYQLDTCLNIIG